MEDAPNTASHIDQEPPEQESEVALVSSILSQLARVDTHTRERILETVATFYGIGFRSHAQPTGQPLAQGPDRSAIPTTFSEDRSISPKQFMTEKQPTTDVEKVACLAYYLTHYRNAPHFKTLDISKLNTEAAQIKFTNATVAVDNATKRNYLVPATKGNKQLSALGEQFVQALPDRERAKTIMSSARPRRRTRKIANEADDTE